jgi:protein-disulfide isomerase
MISRQKVAGGRRFSVRRQRFLKVALAVTLGAACPVLQAAQGLARAADSPDKVLATVGSHKITQGQVDQKILQRILQTVDSSKLYSWRKQELDGIVNNYVIEQAAKKAGMTPDQYMAHELSTGGSGKVTESDASKFYHQHKEQLQARTGEKSFEQVKGSLISALQQQQDAQRRDQVIARLKAEQKVNVMLVEPRFSVASGGHPSAGGKDAPITIVEFSDFQCPFCRGAENSIKAVRDKYGDRIRVIYMDFPLGMHAHAMEAARAGRCAAEQDKFWQFHDAMFADQSKLAATDLKATAQKLGLDAKQFDTCFDQAKPDAGIRQDMAQGQSLGVTGTPTFFINGRELVGAQPPPKFNEVIDEELARAKSPGAQHEAKAN